MPGSGGGAMSGQDKQQIWVGGLPNDITENELTRKFDRYGDVKDVRIRHSPKDTFAFISFHDDRDADVAISKLDRSEMFGKPIKVAWAQEDKGKSRDEDRGRDDGWKDRGRDDGWRDRGGGGRGGGGGGRWEDRRGDSRNRGRGRSRSPAQRRYRDRDSKITQGKYKITIEGIPDDMSWLELKDLGKEYGRTVTFSRTYRKHGSNNGMLEFETQEDADRVRKELDGRRVQGCKSRLRVFEGFEDDHKDRR